MIGASFTEEAEGDTCAAITTRKHRVGPEEEVPEAGETEKKTRGVEARERA
jgi:hypothetical protein